MIYQFLMSCISVHWCIFAFCS